VTRHNIKRAGKCLKYLVINLILTKFHCSKNFFNPILFVPLPPPVSEPLLIEGHCWVPFFTPSFLLPYICWMYSYRLQIHWVFHKKKKKNFWVYGLFSSATKLSPWRMPWTIKGRSSLHSSPPKMSLREIPYGDKGAQMLDLSVPSIASDRRVQNIWSVALIWRSTCLFQITSVTVSEILYVNRTKN
jgi:hypothetical protein